MDEELADESLAFLYKAAASRGPGKRPVRVVSREKLLANFQNLAGASDDDDEDYNFEENGSEDEEGDSDTNSKAEESDDQAENSGDRSEESGDEENPVDPDDPDYVENKRKRSGTGDKNRKNSASHKKQAEDSEKSSASAVAAEDSADNFATEEFNDDDDDAEDSASAANFLCCLCLNLRYPDDEVVQCDLCGLTVHEGCYGIADGNSEAELDLDALYRTSGGGGIDQSENEEEAKGAELTEPWFCEPCLAGLNPKATNGNQPGSVYCELCPVQGGAFKRTEGGRWVHLLCAFYTPRVTFGDVYKLTCVSLANLPANKYGAKSCDLCSDKLLSRTGISAKCDAGMCKSHMHVTCAQKAGLLVDSSMQIMMMTSSSSTPMTSSAALNLHNSATVADPYYLCCPMHSDKRQVAQKKRLFAKWAQFDKRTPIRTLSKREKEWLDVKSVRFADAFRRAHVTTTGQQGSSSTSSSLADHSFSLTGWSSLGSPSARRSSAAAAANQTQSSWHQPPDDKPQRLMSTNHEFMSKMRLKSHLAAQVTDDQWAHEFRAGFVPQMIQNGKFVVPPAFAADFITYYGAREQHIPVMEEKVRKLTEQNRKLTAAQENLREKFNTIVKENEQLSIENERDFDRLKSWCQMLKNFGCTKALKIPDPPPSLNSNNKKRSTNVLRSSSPSKSILGGSSEKSIKSSISKMNASHVTMTSPGGDQNSTNQGTRRGTKQKFVPYENRSPQQAHIHECATCRQSTDQHLLAFCDTCKQRYHLACLDPPLLKMPRKTASYGWECSSCCHKNDESDDSSSNTGADPKNAKNQGGSAQKVDVDAPRQLRTEHKPVLRYIVETAHDYPLPKNRNNKATPKQQQQAAAAFKRSQTKNSPKFGDQGGGKLTDVNKTVKDELKLSPPPKLSLQQQQAPLKTEPPSNDEGGVSASPTVKRQPQRYVVYPDVLRNGKRSHGLMTSSSASSKLTANSASTLMNGNTAFKRGHTMTQQGAAFKRGHLSAAIGPSFASFKSVQHPQTVIKVTQAGSTFKVGQSFPSGAYKRGNGATSPTVTVKLGQLPHGIKVSQSPSTFSMAKFGGQSDSASVAKMGQSISSLGAKSGQSPTSNKRPGDRNSPVNTSVAAKRPHLALSPLARQPISADHSRKQAPSQKQAARHHSNSISSADFISTSTSKSGSAVSPSRLKNTSSSKNLHIQRGSSNRNSKGHDDLSTSTSRDHRQMPPPQLKAFDEESLGDYDDDQDQDVDEEDWSGRADDVMSDLLDYNTAPVRRRAYTEESLREAVRAVHDGEIRPIVASKIYRIPRATLSRHLRKFRNVSSTGQQSSTKVTTPGSSGVLNEDDDNPGMGSPTKLAGHGVKSSPRSSRGPRAGSTIGHDPDDDDGGDLPDQLMQHNYHTSPKKERQQQIRGSFKHSVMNNRFQQEMIRVEDL